MGQNIVVRVNDENTETCIIAEEWDRDVCYRQHSSKWYAEAIDIEAI